MEREPDRDTGGGRGPPLVRSAYGAGDRIAGRYQLIRVLERGGMGVVWIAHHLGLDVHVALKLLRPDVGSADAGRRLIREARAAARIDHPAVLRVLDVGTTDAGDPFLVMELLEGECLADVLRRERRLDPAVAVRTILPVAEALSALHEKGIVHRDVKPENIFLAQGDSRRWQPKLIDFGAVKVRGRGSLHRISSGDFTIGTPIYMSPEQIQGQEADARSDLFALSLVLYEAIAGVPPFNRESIATLMADLLLGEPRPLSDHGVDEPELWAIIQRGLAPHAARWPSAGEMSDALARWLRAHGETEDIGGVALRSIRCDGDGATVVASSTSPAPSASARTPGSDPVGNASSPMATTHRLARGAISAALARAAVRRSSARSQGARALPRPVRIRGHLALGLAVVVLAALLIAASHGADGQAPPPASTVAPAAAPSPPARQRATVVPPRRDDSLR